jgi:hypothetical protein
MRMNMPLLTGFLRKFVFDVLPAALASAVGGLLLAHHGLGPVAQPVAAQVTPASPEMMELLRDEHGLIVNFLKARIANEKKQLEAADAAPRAAAADVGVQPPAVVRQPVVTVAAKPAQPRSRTPVVAAPPQPIVIAQAQPTAALKTDGENSDSLVPKTFGIKDHVVAVTQSVVSAIGSIPSWIGSIGDHIGGEDPAPRPRVDVVSASS